MIDMNNKRVFTIVLCLVVAHAVLLFTGGCKSKEETARITFNAEGPEFSDAEISIDNKSAGRLEQTIIKSNGELYINGQLSTTLPPGSPQISEEDACSGVLDSIILKPGDHTITFTSSEGKSLQITAVVSPGYHLVIYSPAQETIKWNNKTVKAISGTPVTIKGSAR
jgi:hypothetical protein